MLLIRVQIYLIIVSSGVFSPQTGKRRAPTIKWPLLCLFHIFSPCIPVFSKLHFSDEEIDFSDQVEYGPGADEIKLYCTVNNRQEVSAF